jgi:hypothetical protein
MAPIPLAAHTIILAALPAGVNVIPTATPMAMTFPAKLSQSLMSDFPSCLKSPSILAKVKNAAPALAFILAKGDPAKSINPAASCAVLLKSSIPVFELLPRQ